MLATTALGSRSLATTLPAPRFVNIDANGVDLTTGKVQFAFGEGGIGSGEGAVRFQRIFAQDAGYVDNYSGGMFDATVGGVAKTYVQIAGISDVFTRSGSTYTADNASGSTLVFDSGTSRYIYTAADGTLIVFDYIGYDPQYSYSCPGANPATCHVPLSITKPNGLKINFTWQTGVLCYNIPGEPCASEKDYRRLTGISTSAGFSASLTYVSSGIGVWPSPNPDWFKRASISFTNNAGAPSPLPTITYGYPSSTVVTITDPGSRQWQLTTDASGRITGVRRPGSASDNITYAYGADGTVSSATKEGITTTYSRFVNGSTATETATDPLTQQTVTTADLTKGRPTSFKDEFNRITAYEYDANSRLTRVTQPELNYTQFAYDARGNVMTTTNVAKPGSGLANVVTSASFDASCTNIVKCNKPNSTTDARSNITSYTYDATHGGVTSITRPADATGKVPQVRYSYNQVSSASGDLVYELTSVSACQTQTAIPNPTCLGTSDEAKGTIAYNSNLLPTSVTRANGTGTLSAATTATYDSRGRVGTVDGPLSGTADTTKYRWDGADQLIGVTDPDPDGAGAMKDRAVRLTYRPDGQISKQELGTVVDQSDSAWAAFAPVQAVDIGFDSNSRPVTSKFSAGGTDYALTQTSYDSRGRTDCTAVRMNTAVYGSLPAACTQSTLGSFGPDRINQVVYDNTSEPTQLKVGVGTADAATERTLTYSNNGLVQTLTDGENNKTTYIYDGFDRLSQAQYPNTTKGSGTSNPSDYEQLTYDLNSNVTQYRARNTATIAFGYDNLDRVISKTSAALPTVNYTYDLIGRLTTALFASNSQGTTNSFDALSRLTSSSANVGGTARSMSYLYDLAGRRTRVTWWDNFYADYDRLVTGELSKVRENGATSGHGVLATYGYDDLRRRVSLTRGNTAVTSWAWDPVSRLASLTHNLTGTANDVTLTFAYNPASQITSTTRSNDAYSFTYANTNTGYTSNGLNQYTGICSPAPCYDTNGNLTNDGSRSYTYDAENKLTSSAAGGVTTTLSYDPLNRLDTYNPGSSRRFIYDGGEAVAELDSGGIVRHRFVRGDNADEVLVDYASADSSSRRSIHADERGSAIAGTDDSGNPVAIDRYDEYGNPGSANLFRHQYTGQAWLSEIGLNYYKARMYSPALGRFLQTDPIGMADSPNLYQYVLDDPVNNIDPMGLSCAPGQTSGTGTDGEDCSPIPVIGRRRNTINVTEGSFPFFLLIPEITLSLSDFSFGGDSHQCSANGLLAPPAAVSAGEAAAATIGSWLGVIALALLPGSDTPRPEPQYVVRGGITTPESLIRGSSLTPYYRGGSQISGFSVVSAPGMSVNELAMAARFPNALISYTTTAQLAGVGVPVVPTRGNVPNHATAVVPVPLDLARATTISSQFEQEPNPARCQSGG